MRTEAYDILPTPVRRSLKKLGRDIQIARKRRRLTIAMMLERVGISKMTYMAVEKGDPRVGIGIYGTALMVVGFGTPFAEIADPVGDDEGLALDEARLPERVRPRSGEPAL